jgi:ribose 5-phosphate isomerase RpiB
MHIGIAADHGGYNLKETLARALGAAGHKVVDFGAAEFWPNEDDELNILCIGQRVMWFDLAWDVVGAFLGEQQHLRRLTKIANLERDHALAVVCAGL